MAPARRAALSPRASLPEAGTRLCHSLLVFDENERHGIPSEDSTTADCPYRLALLISLNTLLLANDQEDVSVPINIRVFDGTVLVFGSARSVNVVVCIFCGVKDRVQMSVVHPVN